MSAVESFVSEHAEESAFLSSLNSWIESGKQLTAGQYSAVVRIMSAHNGPAIVIPNDSGIVALLARAKGARPFVYFHGLRFGRGKLPQSVRIVNPSDLVDGPWGPSARWIGDASIGTFVPRAGTSTEECRLIDAVFDMDLDTLCEALASHGRATNRCCYCDRPLTDGRSVSHGYGPVCADTHGLPWNNPAGWRTA